MLREALDVQTAAAGLPGRDASDEAQLRFQSYQNFSSGVQERAGLNREQPFMIKNKELFAKA